MNVLGWIPGVLDAYYLIAMHFFRIIDPERRIFQANLFPTKESYSSSYVLTKN